MEDCVMQKLVVIAVVLLVGLVLVLGMVGPVHAGQPNQSCQAQTSSPGSASSAPGSAFNSNGTAGTVYAGQQPQNSQNPNSVSQYDVACFQVSNNGGH